MAVSESDDDEYHSLGSPADATPGDEVADEEDGESTSEPPVHPVPSMQAAFEESILEATTTTTATATEGGADDGWTSPSAESRRRQLLESHRYDDSWKTRWKQRPGAQYHPLLKLIAQIVFGLHLLQQEQAKSNEEVVRILQTHVNEVDSFLERTSDDFDMAITDIEERIRHLKLPMQHLEVFDNMLDDKGFRTQLLDGNEKIERIIDRTAKAMNAALMDIQRGLHTTQELGKYLDSVKDQWPTHDKAIINVYVAMRGNEQGWMQYLKALQLKGNNLGHVLVQLGTLIGEMAKMAAVASRRNRPTSPPRSSKSVPTSPALRSKFSRGGAEVPPVPSFGSRNLSLNKPLPREPDAVDGAAQFTISRLQSVPSAQRYERPRQAPQSPPSASRRVATEPNAPRPRTAGEPRGHRYAQMGSSQLAEFLQISGPLRSNPPDPQLSAGKKGESLQAARPTRSHSQGASEMATQQEESRGRGMVARSKTHGGAVIVKTPRGQEKKSTDTTRSVKQKSESGSRKDSVLASTGFARRFSKRIKHIAPPYASAPPSTTSAGGLINTTTTNESKPGPDPTSRNNKLSTTFEPPDTISTDLTPPASTSAQTSLPTDSAYASPTTNNPQTPKTSPVPEEASPSSISARSARFILFPNNSSRPVASSVQHTRCRQMSEPPGPTAPYRVQEGPNDAAGGGAARHEVDGDGGQTVSGEILPNVATATAGASGAPVAEVSPVATRGGDVMARTGDDYPPPKIRGARVRNLFHRRKVSKGVFASS